MNIGFVNIIPWRPHYKSARFIAERLSDLGHSTHLINCRGHREHCFQRLLNQRMFECSYCQYSGRLNGLMFPGKSYRLSEPIQSQSLHISTAEYSSSVLSSVGSARREELDNWHCNAGADAGTRLLADTQLDYLALVDSYRHIYSTLGLHLVAIFNGRFHDVGAAISAAQSLKIPFITYERSWFGRGLQLNSNCDCLDIGASDLNLDKPLTDEHIDTALSLIRARISGNSKGEWRSYGQGRQTVLPESVPAPLRNKVLVVPSSRSEFLGHPDYAIDTQLTSIDRLELFLNHYDISPRDVVIRAHPAWTTPIGSNPASASHTVYQAWANKLGATYIDPKNTQISTYDLMRHSRIAVFNGGSAVAEATLLKLPTVLLSPSAYSRSGFVTDLTKGVEAWPAKLPTEVTPEQVVMMLRYIWFRYFSQVTFFDSVRQITSIKFEYKSASPYDIDCLNRVLTLSQGGLRFGIRHQPIIPPTAAELAAISRHPHL